VPVPAPGLPVPDLADPSLLDDGGVAPAIVIEEVAP
jgi:hypothetical protein